MTTPTTTTITPTETGLLVAGVLHYETIMSLWAQSLPLLNAHPSCCINLSRVTSSNSAGVALLVEWMKYAKQQDIKITFDAIPPHLQSILTVSGIEIL